jgi:hypothetical protein
VSQRSTNEILNEAAAELREREDRLVEIAARVHGELTDVRRAIRRLGKTKVVNKGKAPTSRDAAKPTASGLTGDQLSERIIEVLDASLDPLTPTEVSAKVEGTTPQGVSTKLRWMLKDDKVVRIDGNKWGLPSPIETDEAA